MDNSEFDKRLEDITANIGDMALKRRVKEVLRSLDIKTKETVLDCGCGEGLYLMAMSGIFPDAAINGFDIDTSSMEVAKKHLEKANPDREFSNRVNVDFKIGNICDMPYEDNYFDKICCSEVLEHVEDDRKALNELRRILKPGGKLVVTVPNHNYPFLWDPINKIAETFFKTHIKDGFFAGIWNMHLRLYDINEITGLVENAGFEIKDVKALTHYSIPFNHIILYGLKNLLNSGMLPAGISNTADKFSCKSEKQSRLIKFGYSILKIFDKLNDDINKYKSSVSLLIEAVKAENFVK